MMISKKNNEYNPGGDHTYVIFNGQTVARIDILPLTGNFVSGHATNDNGFRRTGETGKTVYSIDKLIENILSDK